MLNYHPNLHLPTEPVQLLSLSFLTAGRGNALDSYLQMMDLKVFQALCVSADHKINGVLQTVLQAQYE
jgi:hypothetical protein